VQKVIIKMFGYAQFIGPAGVEELKRYKYKSGEYSTFDNLMNPFWFQATELLPLVRKNHFALILFLSGLLQT